MTPLSVTTYAQIVRSVAAEHKVELTDDQVELILWEHTGFPSFWTGEPASTCAAQVRELLGGMGG